MTTIERDAVHVLYEGVLVSFQDCWRAILVNQNKEMNKLRYVNLTVPVTFLGQPDKRTTWVCYALLVEGHIPKT